MVPPMTFVLHLVADPLRLGQLVGIVEVAATGRRVPVRDADELVRVVVALGSAEAGGLADVVTTPRRG
jgi:hypothetical protein